MTLKWRAKGSSCGCQELSVSHSAVQKNDRRAASPLDVAQVCAVDIHPLRFGCVRDCGREQCRERCCPEQETHDTGIHGREYAGTGPARFRARKRWEGAGTADPDRRFCQGLL